MDLATLGGAEVDDDGFRAGGRVNPQMVVLGDGQQGLPQPVRVKTKVDKARPGNLPACGNLVRVQPRHNGLGQLAGILFAGLGHRHDAVGLIVAEFRVGRGFDYRRGGRPAGGLNGLCRLFFQELLYCWHTLTCAMIFENNLPPGIQSRRLERTKRRTVACGESEQGWNAERTRRRPRPAGETGSPCVWYGGVGNVTYRQLLERFASPREILRASPAMLTEAGISARIAREIAAFDQWQAVEAELEHLAGLNARLVTQTESEYPERLRQIHDPPPFLYIRGAFYAPR